MPDSSSVRKPESEPEKTTAVPGDSPSSGSGSDSTNSSLSDLSQTRPTVDTIANAENLTDHKLGDFHLLRKLGQGGMADVYLAEQISLNRQVAIKILHEDLRSDDVHLKRFAQEAKAAGGLHHPNIVQVFVIGEEEGTHYIAQEYVQGWNLREYLNRNGPPDAPTAIAIMRQVASALQAAEEAGIVHRDIKPENILITRKGEAKVTDFGLAQLSQTSEGVNLTQVGITMGTPLYMSPEQVNGKKLDHRSDIYSFGVTFYHMLAGQPPFHGETAMSVAIQHVNNTPPPLSERRNDIPPALCQLIHKMMAKKADNRYPSAHAVLNDLRKIAKVLQEQPGGVADLSLSQFGMPALASSETTAPLGTRILQWSRSHLAAAFVLSFLLVGSTAAAIGWVMRPPDPFAHPAVENNSKIRELNSAGEQYFLAVRLNNDEEAWRAVIQHFPDDTKYTPRAKVELAFLYLRSGQREDAKIMFDEIVELGEKDNYFKAHALAGKAVIASLDKKYQDSDRIISMKLKDDLREELMEEVKQLIRVTILENSKSRGAEINQELIDLFEPAIGEDLE